VAVKKGPPVASGALAAALKKLLSPEGGPPGIPGLPTPLGQGVDLMGALLSDLDPTGAVGMVSPLAGLEAGAARAPGQFRNAYELLLGEGDLATARDMRGAAGAKWAGPPPGAPRGRTGGLLSDAGRVEPLEPPPSQSDPAALGDFDLSDLIPQDRTFEERAASRSPSIPMLSAEEFNPGGPPARLKSRSPMPPLDPQDLLAPGARLEQLEPFVTPEMLMDPDASTGPGAFRSPGSPSLPPGRGPGSLIPTGDPLTSLAGAQTSPGALVPRKMPGIVQQNQRRPLEDLLAGVADNAPFRNTGEMSAPFAGTVPGAPGPGMRTAADRPGALTNPGRPGAAALPGPSAGVEPPPGFLRQSDPGAPPVTTPPSEGLPLAAGVAGGGIAAGLGGLFQQLSSLLGGSGGSAEAAPSRQPPSASSGPSGPSGPALDLQGQGVEDPSGPPSPDSIPIPAAVQGFMDDATKLGQIGSARGLWGPAATPQGVDLQKLMAAFKAQESGGDPMARNERTDASGLYQIMPSNIGPWSQEAGLGDVTQEQFLGSPELQEKVARFKLEQYLKEAKGATQDPDEQVRRVASAWYSGRPDLFENIRGVGPNQDEPSIRQYSLGILSKYKGKPQSGRLGSVLAHALNPMKRLESTSVAKTGIPTRALEKDLPSSPYDEPLPPQIQEALDAEEQREDPYVGYLKRSGRL
jgi:transglycosylase-like protein with SLT domain